MSDYVKATTFSTKDGLDSGEPLKLLAGAEFDTEFDAIAIASATKYDSDSIASEQVAKDESDNTVVMTPLRTANWADANLGLVGDLQALSSDPAADRLVFFDDTDNSLKFLTIGDGIEISSTTIQLPAALAGAGLTLTSGVLAVVGIKGITANANDVQITDVVAGVVQPVTITDGTVTFPLGGITEITGAGLDQAADGFLVSNAGALNVMPYDDAGIIVQSAMGTQTLALTDANTLMEFDATSTLTIPTNASVAMPVGSSIIIVVDHATQVVTVTAASGVNLNSVFHPGGTDAASDTVRAGGSAMLIKTATDEWYLAGDIVT